MSQTLTITYYLADGSTKTRRIYHVVPEVTGAIVELTYPVQDGHKHGHMHTLNAYVPLSYFDDKCLIN